MTVPLLNPLPFLSQMNNIDDAAHIIQMALTPVFMLSGIGTLINIFNTRLARVSDHLDNVNRLLAAPPSEQDHQYSYDTPQRLKTRQKRLTRRIVVLDLAIILNGLGGAMTCGAAIALFVGSLGDATTSLWLLALFGTALGCTVAALLAFLADTLLSWHGLRHEGQVSLLTSLLRSKASHAKRHH
ncbi:DUF2721 domain-containing protein [Bombella favorum]|uniref:DUF2721 domain-containing protein n=1 Tax=Bombella favorum TaxID=2039164 RepID=UPI001E57F991|nr:DUF2721 domain-containing protein [Bombella favorum]